MGCLKDRFREQARSPQGIYSGHRLSVRRRSQGGSGLAREWAYASLDYLELALSFRYI